MQEAVLSLRSDEFTVTSHRACRVSDWSGAVTGPRRRPLRSWTWAEGRRSDSSPGSSSPPAGTRTERKTHSIFFLLGSLGFPDQPGWDLAQCGPGILKVQSWRIVEKSSFPQRVYWSNVGTVVSRSFCVGSITWFDPNWTISMEFNSFMVLRWWLHILPTISDNICITLPQWLILQTCSSTSNNPEKVYRVLITHLFIFSNINIQRITAEAPFHTYLMSVINNLMHWSTDELHQHLADWTDLLNYFLVLLAVVAAFLVGYRPEVSCSSKPLNPQKIILTDYWCYLTASFLISANDMFNRTCYWEALCFHTDDLIICCGIRYTVCSVSSLLLPALTAFHTFNRKNMMYTLQSPLGWGNRI